MCRQDEREAADRTLGGQGTDLGRASAAEVAALGGFAVACTERVFGGCDARGEAHAEESAAPYFLSAVSGAGR